MKKHRSQASLSALIFYLILLAVWFFSIYTTGKTYWYAGLAPWYGLGLVLLLSGTRYKIDQRQLIVRNPIERKAINLKDIEEIEEVHNPFWKRVLTGFPQYSFRVKYDKQEQMLHTNHPEELKTMLDIGS